MKSCAFCGKELCNSNRKYCSVRCYHRQYYNKYHKKENQKIKRKCLRCKKDFIVSKKQPWQKYCSNTCQATSRYREIHKLKHIIYCELCGKEIPKGYRIDKRFCSDNCVSKDWRQKNPFKFKMKQKRRYAKRKEHYNTFTNKEWFQKLKDCFGICTKCKKYIGIDKLTCDHIVPLSKALKDFIYTIDDVQPLCRSCNSSKNNRIE